MLYHLFIAVVGILGLLTVWLGIQALARHRGAGHCDGPDPLACRGCAPDRARSCHLRRDDPDTE